MGDVYTNPPQSRNEAILNSIVEGTTYTDPPQSRIEDLLLQVKDVIEEGGHDESATRASIAPTESDSAHASKKIEVGEQFYLSDDKLYTATSPISQGSAIVVYPTASYNCKLSDSVTEQIKSLDDSKVENSVIGNVEDGATASQAYAVGEHFTRGGKFCTCKANMAQGETWTLNTKYVEGTLGDVIYKHYKKTGVTVEAGGVVSISIPTISGYVPVNISASTRGTGASVYFNVVFNDSSSDIIESVKIRNMDSSSHTWSINLFVIYTNADILVTESI